MHRHISPGLGTTRTSNADRHRGYALGLALCLSSLGCGGDDDGAGFCGTPAGGCDIRTPACQRRIYQATACVGGFDAGDPPNTRTITVAELDAELREQAESEPPSAMAERWNAALRTLGLLRSGQNLTDGSIEVTVDRVAAYYHVEAKRITVIDRGGAVDPESDLYTLSHEFVHALRDARTGLKDFREQHVDSSDSSVAVSSLFEGEAVVISTDLLAHSRGPGHYVDWSRLASVIRESILEDIDTTAHPFVAAVRGLPYALGTDRLWASWVEQGPDAMDAAFATPRRSALEWTDSTAQAVRLECYPTAPPPGYVALDHDMLGVAGLLALPVALDALDARDALSRAGQWRNDSIVLFGPEGDADGSDVAVAWRVRLDFVGAADAFVADVGCCLPPDARLRRHPPVEVVLYAASQPGLVDAWTDVTQCGTSDELPSTGSGMAEDMRSMLGWNTGARLDFSGGD